MIDRAPHPRVTGSGSRLLAEGQAERHVNLALVLAYTVKHWPQHFPTPISDEMRADAARRIEEHMAEATRWRQAIDEYSRPTVDDTPAQLREARR